MRRRAQVDHAFVVAVAASMILKLSYCTHAISPVHNFASLTLAFLYPHCMHIVSHTYAHIRLKNKEHAQIGKSRKLGLTFQVVFLNSLLLESQDRLPIIEIH